MKGFFTKCLLFAAIMAVLNAAYVLLLLQISPSLQKVKEAHALQGQHHALLIMGNSMALDGFDAHWLSQRGVSSYNFAVGGSHIKTTLLQLQHYLRNNQPPKYVVIALSSAVGRSYMNKIAYYNPEVDLYYRDQCLDYVSNPPLLNMQWLLIDAIKVYTTPEFRNASFALGQWRTTKSLPDQSKLSPWTQTPPKYYTRNLRRLLKVCANHHIQPILIEMPASKGRRNAFPSTYHIELNGKRWPIHNLNNYQLAGQLFNDQTDWLSADHLNVNGGQKLTSYFYQHIFPLYP